MTPAAGRPRRSEQLTADLLDLIRVGVVQPGTKLPTEAELSERFGVSRTVVREAIAQLGAAGIVRSHQGRGTFVLAVPPEGSLPVGEIPVTGIGDLLRLLELRTALEVEAAGLAAGRRTAEQLSQIRGALAGLAAAGRNPSEQVDADFTFHLAVARATGNDHFRRFIESLGKGMLAIPKDRLVPEPETGRRLVDEHAAIAEAIAACDVAWARSAMRTHLANSAHRLVAQP